MSNQEQLKEVELTQFYGGTLGTEMALTLESDKQKLKAHVPKYVIPVVFIHGVMGGNLRLSKQQQSTLKTEQEYAWQPDSILDTGGMLSAVLEILAGFLHLGVERLIEFNHATRIMSSTPKERQINFDPKQVTIDPYCPDDDLQKFDSTGKADKRQSAVKGTRIPPYLKDDTITSELTKQKTKAEQKARWRGWGEPVFAKGAGYEAPLKELECRLNNRMKDGKATVLWKKGGVELTEQKQGIETHFEWKSIVNKSTKEDYSMFRDKAEDAVGSVTQDEVPGEEVNYMTMVMLKEFEEKNLEKLQIIDKDPETWNQPLTDIPMFAHAGPKDGPVTENDLKKLEDVFFPVHAMAYNWLQSNAVSGKDTAKRIKKLIKHYNDHTHMKCEHVIILSHSMGGYVTRAVLHPEMGNLQDKVLGVYHNVMPTVGAAMTYRRMRGGTGGKGLMNKLTTNKILGPTGRDVTAIMGNAPATLEMLPNIEYGLRYAQSVGSTDSWVKVRLAGKVIGSFPESVASSPVSSDLPSFSRTV